VSTIRQLIKELRTLYRYEIILIENGSKDNTYYLAKKLSQEYKTIRVFHLPTPCYGAALKKGIIHARFPLIIQFDLDLVDLTFLKNAVALLDVNDIVVGSKMLPGSHDGRAPFRNFASRLINFLLHIIFHYKGTDTHGVKAYRKSCIVSISQKLRPSHLFFDTEIILTAEKKGMSIVELPVSVKNLRPSRFNTKIIMTQLVEEFVTLVRKRNVFIKNEISKPFITADDFYLNGKVNKAITSLVIAKKIQNVSVLPNGKVRTRSPDTHISIHISLIEGKPVLPSHVVSSLVNRRGYFYPFPLFFLRLCMRKIDIQELKEEINAQIVRIKKLHKPIYEINSHQHTHLFYPIDEVVDLLAQRHNIKKIRTYGNICHYSFYGYCIHAALFFCAGFEQLCYGKMLFQSPTLKRGAIPLSFMSWETSTSPQKEKVEIICHPGTRYDKNTLYTSLLT